MHDLSDLSVRLPLWCKLHVSTITVMEFVDDIRSIIILPRFGTPRPHHLPYIIFISAFGAKIASLIEMFKLTKREAN